VEVIFYRQNAPKPVSKKAKQAAAAAAMAAAATTPRSDVDTESAADDAGGASSSADVDSPRVTLIDAAGVPDASTVSAGSARADDSSTVGTSVTKESLEAFLAEAKPGEDLHWRLMNQAMDMVNITTSTYQSKVHPNSKDIALSNVSCEDATCCGGVVCEPNVLSCSDSQGP